jgi:hypothetical protein
VEIDEDPLPKWGLGRSIYSPEQLEVFHEFQMSTAVRAAYVADTSELTFKRRSADCQWGLALGQHAQEAIIDMIGLSFIPLYRIIGLASMIVIFVLFFVGMTRITSPSQSCSGLLCWAVPEAVAIGSWQLSLAVSIRS